MNDKLVSIEEVKRTLEKSYYGEATLGELLETLDELEALSPVPQEMSAREFFEEYQRMCHTVDGCSDCPTIGIDKCTGFPCRYRAYLNPDKAIAVVEAWAKEHPEERSEDSNVN